MRRGMFFVSGERVAVAVMLVLVVGSVSGSVGRNWGLILAFVTASKLEASLINVGSLKAVPMKEIPTGSPNSFPEGTLIIG